MNYEIETRHDSEGQEYNAVHFRKRTGSTFTILMDVEDRERIEGLGMLKGVCLHSSGFPYATIPRSSGERVRNTTLGRLVLEAKTWQQVEYVNQRERLDVRRSNLSLVKGWSRSSPSKALNTLENEDATYATKMVRKRNALLDLNHVYRERSDEELKDRLVPDDKGQVQMPFNHRGSTRFAVIDADDYDRLWNTGLKLTLSLNSVGTVMLCLPREAGSVSDLATLSRIVMAAGHGQVVKHRNGDKLDVTKANLYLAKGQGQFQAANDLAA